MGEQVHAISLKVQDVAGKKIEQKIVRPLLKKHLNSEAAAASNSYMWAAWLCLIVLGVLVFAAMAYSLVYLLWPLEVYVCADWGHFFDPLMCTPHIESNPRTRPERSCLIETVGHSSRARCFDQGSSPYLGS